MSPEASWSTTWPLWRRWDPNLTMVSICTAWLKRFLILSGGEMEVHRWRLNTKPTPWCVIGAMCRAWQSQQEVRSDSPSSQCHQLSFQRNEEKLCLCYSLNNVYTFPLTVVDQENVNMCNYIIASEITVAKFPSQSTRITKSISMI